MEGYKNLYIKLKVKRLNKNHFKENTLRGNRIQIKGQGIIKPPKRIFNYRRNLIYFNNYLKEKNINIIKNVPKVVMADKINFLYYLNQKESRLKYYWL